MKLASIWSEAARNTISGVSRGLLFSMLLAAALLGAFGSDATAIARIETANRTFHDAGATTIVIEVKGQIDGSKCEALNRVDGVLASGAIAVAESSLVARSLPSNPIATFNISPSFGRLLGVESVQPGYLVEQTLATTLGVNPGETLETTVQPGTVSAIFHYPDDGRKTLLTRSVLAPVAAGALFDECWIDVWPQNPSLESLARLAVASSATEKDEVSVYQLNRALGPTYDVGEQFDSRITSAIWLVTLLIGLVLGFTSIQLRRLEFASALHAGQHRIALTLQVALETLCWAVAGLALCTPGIIYFANSGIEPSDIPEITALLFAECVAGCVGAVVGAIAASAIIRESRLFALFKER